MDIVKVISGGQSGADFGGLLAAKGLGIPTGGYIPKGFRTENGSKPELAEYGLMETESSDYPERTRLNIEESDVTIIFSPTHSSGSVLTRKIAESLKKPHLFIEEMTIGTSDVVADFLKRCEPKVINVAGNRESRSRGIQDAVLITMKNALQNYREYGETK